MTTTMGRGGSGFGADLDLADLNGANGFVIKGIAAGDTSGRSVSSAGDVDGDGFDDVVIGARDASPNGVSEAGESYVVFGAAGECFANLDLSSLDGSNGFVLNGIDAYDGSGWSVSSAGDVNGDGYDDLIIGAPLADPSGTSGAGESYVVFGKAGGFDTSLDLATIDGRNGFILEGSFWTNSSGVSVSAAGDVNGDGFDDVIIAATDRGGSIVSRQGFVVFGGANAFDEHFDLSSLDGGNGFVIEGFHWDDASVISVSSAGDINGDGFDDVIVGDPRFDVGSGLSAGNSYLVFGREDGFAAGVNVSAMDGSNGFVLEGVDLKDISGGSVSGAGDINGDGFDDLIIGASGADPGDNLAAGESYVVFGKADGFASSLDLAGLDGSNGFVINGVDRGDFSGSWVSSAGDINGDGFDDFIIGAWRFDLGGASYVVFGKEGGFAASLDLSDLDGVDGFVINGSAGQMGDASDAGDVNGDGYDDLIIGAPGTDPNGIDQGGESYVVFGGPQFGASLQEGSTADDTLNGTSGRDSMLGSRGNDVLRGRRGNDTLEGGSQDDSLTGGGGRDSLVGGNGHDTLAGGAGDDELEGGGLADKLRGGGGNDTLDGGDGWDRLHGNDGDDLLSGGDGSDHLFGDGGADTLKGGAFADVLDGGEGNDILDGDVGNDLLRGGEGDDVMIGGLGADMFEIRGGHGADVVVDFHRTQGDRILIRGFEEGLDTFTELAAYVDDDPFGSTIDLTFFGGGTLLLEGVSGLVAEDIEFA